MQLPPQSIDPNVPTQIPDDQLQDFKSFLDVVLDTVIGGAAPDVHTLGLQLWGGLAAVMVAWTGLKIAFSGTFDAWTIVKLVIGIAIPRTLLHYYVVPIPGVGLTFPAMIASGGIWLQNLFLSDVVSAGYTEMTALVQAYSAHLSAAIAILLGPVFIAFLLFEPLAFLFWGWFRTLMVYTLYGVVAGAVLRVFMGVGMGYITTYADALMGTGTSDPMELWLWAVVLLPLVVCGLMASLKVGELAAMLVSGSGNAGSGFVALVMRGAGGAVAPAAAAKPPV